MEKLIKLKTKQLSNQNTKISYVETRISYNDSDVNIMKLILLSLNSVLIMTTNMGMRFLARKNLLFFFIWLNIILVPFNIGLNLIKSKLIYEI